MKKFNFNTTIKIAILILILSGCGSLKSPTSTDIDLSTIKEYNTTQAIVESNNTEIDTIATQIEENLSPPLATPLPQTSTEIEMIDVKEEETEQENIYTTNITDIALHEIKEIEEIQDLEDTKVVEAVVLDYTQKFINEKSCSQIIDKEFLTICYDHKLKVAKGVAYTLYGDLVNELNIKKRPSFYVERAIEAEYRTSSSDYTGTGYDRGHLAPDASFDWSEESLDATYSLANIIPQVPEVNRELWTKVERYARDMAVELSEINVVNVIDYNKTPKQIGDSNLAVSQGYYKILFNTEVRYAECFYYTNNFDVNTDTDQLENHKINCNRVNYSF